MRDPDEEGGACINISTSTLFHSGQMNDLVNTFNSAGRELTFQGVAIECCNPHHLLHSTGREPDDRYSDITSLSLNRLGKEIVFLSRLIGDKYLRMHESIDMGQACLDADFHPIISRVR